MPVTLPFPLGLLHLRAGPGAVLAEPLFFPELARLAPDAGKAADAVRRALADLAPRLDAEEWLRRRRAPSGQSLAFSLTLPPPRASEAWREPVRLRFLAAVWDHDGGFVLARVPALGIEVIATAREDLVARLRDEALAAVRRKNLSTGLQPLAWAQTATAGRVEWTTVPLSIPTLKERAIRASEPGEKKSILADVAVRVWSAPPAYESDAAVEQLADALTAKPPQSVLLVGPSGVGKTAAWGELVRRAAKHGLGLTPFYRTGGARLVAGQTGFGMWEERCRELVREAGKKRAVLHVGNLVELMDVGKSECNPTGVAAYLRPAIARGELLCVAECTPEQIPLIEKEDPQLLDAFRHVTLEEPPPAAGRAVLAAFAAADRRREPTRAALDAVDRLHRRYATYSAYPGRPLRFLDRLRRDGPAGDAITEGEVYANFSRETGLPPALLDPAVPLDLTAARAWFAQRVVGQPEAVELVVDLLAGVKAGLARPNRPVASLLFVGPTGVGKTEMAKALAEFLFGAADRLTRFDMSEYGDPVAVRRLVGAAPGAEGLLTAAVRERPFSVVLLDEVEKADRSAFDLLLQALGEARLTDAGGRLADFRNAVVILTSNLGAESFRAGKPGFSGSGTGDAAAHFTAAVEKFLRPEMVNRLDRLVPFAPLGAEVIRRIARREWEKVLARDGVRFRGLAVTADDELLDHVAATGFDVKYGARPLKRAMERELLAPLARQVNRHPGDAVLSVDVRVEAGRPSVAVRPVPGAKPRGAEVSGPAGRLATAAQDLRRWHQLLERSSAARELENDITLLSSAERRALVRQRLGKALLPGDAENMARLGRLREVQAELHRHRAATEELEDEAVAGFHAGDAPAADAPARLERLTAEWDALLFRLHAATHERADRVTLAFFAEHRVHLREVVEAYRADAEAQKVARFAFAYQALTAERARRHESALSTPPTPEGSGEKTVWVGNVLFVAGPAAPRAVLERVHWQEGTDCPVADAVGFGLELTGPAAGVRYAGEAGVHKFLGSPAEEGTPDVWVVSSGEMAGQFRPPVAVARRGAIPAESARRVYDRAKGTVIDRETGATHVQLWGALTGVLPTLLAAAVRHRLRRVVLE